MTEETTRPLSQEAAADGGVAGSTRLTPVDQKVRGLMAIRPTTVVPVIFVPGIMGSNLRNTGTKASIWNTNSTLSIVLQWIFRSASTRQSKLVPDQAEVDDAGTWYGKSGSVANKEVGKDRGQGTTSRAFYGEFVRWLDDELNSEQKAHKLTHTPAPDHINHPSPWQLFADDAELGTTWNAEKPFQLLTKDESDRAWDHFFCPVHVHGYNWLASNGEAGKALADDIDKIIKYWNTQKNPDYHCEKVILVSHSMGGLVTRAAMLKAFGEGKTDDKGNYVPDYEAGSAPSAVAGQVLGIVHGEQPANGAAAAYHHCRSGYGGVSGLVLGRNAAQVTAVFANAPGAMELLPNQQYEDKGKKEWLKARLEHGTLPTIELPKAEGPYIDIYLEKDRWWRLVDPILIDPAGRSKDPWDSYQNSLYTVKEFHRVLGKNYHPQTYAHYGADEDKHPAYGDLVWESGGVYSVGVDELYEAKSKDGSNPVTVKLPNDLDEIKFHIVDPKTVGYPQPGDETVPACSGEAPNLQGGDNVRQSFRMHGFEHQASYNNDDVRKATLYAIGKLLKLADVL